MVINTRPIPSTPEESGTDNFYKTITAICNGDFGLLDKITAEFVDAAKHCSLPADELCLICWEQHPYGIIHQEAVFGEKLYKF